MIITMCEYVLGVDGGATKTNCAIFDIKGNIIDLISWGPTNHEHFKQGFKDLKTELERMIAYALQKNGMDKDGLAKSVFGLAGVDTKRQHATVSEVIKEIGINHYILCNDAYLGVKAGCESGYGICAINGTGFSTAGIDPQGEMLQIGGQGELSGDCGGGGYIGRSAVKYVYNSLFKDSRPSLMSEMFFELLGIDTKYDFLESLTQALDEGKHSIKEFNRLVFAAANKGDKPALEILKNVADEYARSINALISHLNFSKSDNLEIVLTGSIFTKGENPFMTDSLQETVLSKNDDRKIIFRTLDIKPVAGAVIWALEDIGAEKGIFGRVMSQFQFP